VSQHDTQRGHSCCKRPNAAPQPLLEAEARNERTLEAVGCRRWFGAALALDSASGLPFPRPGPPLFCTTTTPYAASSFRFQLGEAAPGRTLGTASSPSNVWPALT